MSYLKKIRAFVLIKPSVAIVILLSAMFLMFFWGNSLSPTGAKRVRSKICYASESAVETTAESAAESDESEKGGDADEASKNAEEEMKKAINDFCEKLDLSALDDFYKNYGGAFRSGDLKQTLLKIACGETPFVYDNAFSLLFGVLGASVKEIVPLLITVFLVSVFYGVTSSLSATARTNELLFNVCYSAAISVVFCEMIALAGGVISLLKSMSVQMSAVFPLATTLLSLSGGNAAVGFFKPIGVFAVGAGTGLALNVLTPISVSVAAVSGISSFSNKFSLKKFSAFLQSAFKWILGSVISVFTFFTAVGGVASSGYDGAIMRVFKYAVAGGIPFVGGFAKDSVDIVLSGATLIKNSIGVVITVCMFFSIFSAIIKIACFSLCLKLISAFCEPISDGRFCEALTAFSKSLSMLVAVLIYVFIMYFVLIAAFIGAQSNVFA